MDAYSLVFGFLAGALMAGTPCLLYAAERAAAAKRAHRAADMAETDRAEAVKLIKHYWRLYRDAADGR